MKNATTATAKNTHITLTSTEFISKYPKAFYDICKRIVLNRVLYLDSKQHVSNKFADALKVGFDDSGILNDLTQTTAYVLITRSEHWHVEQTTAEKKAAALAKTVETINTFNARLQAENLINSSEKTLNLIDNLNNIKQKLHSYEFEFTIIFHDYSITPHAVKKALKKLEISPETYNQMAPAQQEAFENNCRATSETRRRINAEIAKTFRQIEKTTTSEAEEAEKSVFAWNVEMTEAESKMLLAPIMEQLEKVFNAYQLALMRASLNGVKVDELSARLGLSRKKVEYDLRKIYRYISRHFG